ncbi:MAG: YraN family protein [Thiotrichales bacterium]|nr:MAG: YraN family protein [Thiotrichales bacterium]
MTPSARDRGLEAEHACCEYLQRQGLKLLARNYHGRRGELDLVMRERNTVVFVEVRFRKNSVFGGALESITSSKQEKLRVTAEQYLQQETRLKNGRFDVVAMTEKVQNNGAGTYSFEWIKNAF